MESDNCNLCGICNEYSSLHKALKKETYGPRFKAWLSGKGKSNSIFFIDLLEGSVRWFCPAKLDLDEDILVMRAKMVQEGKIPSFCKEILNNFNANGNPVGAIGKDKNYKPYFG